MYMNIRINFLVLCLCLLPANSTQSMEQARSNQNIVHLKGLRKIRMAAFSPDTHFIAITNPQRVTLLCNTATGLSKGIIDHGNNPQHCSLGQSPCISLDNTTWVICEVCNGDIKAWDLRQQRYTIHIAHPIDAIVQHAVINVAGTTIASANKNIVFVYAHPWKEYVCQLRAHKNPITALAFNFFGTLLASADSGQNGIVAIWDTKKSSLVASIASPTQAIKHLAFDAKGETVALVSNHGCIYLWNHRTQKITSPYHDFFTHKNAHSTIKSIRFSPDDTHLLICTKHGNIITLPVVKQTVETPWSTVIQAKFWIKKQN